MAAPPLNPVEAALRETAARLAGIGRPWALVGGLAVSVRAEPRTTRDVDVAVAIQDDAAAERVIFSLSESGFRVLSTLEQGRSRRLATVRLKPPTDTRKRGVVVDLLFASSGIENEVAAAAEKIEIVRGFVVPVATRAHLIALKVLSRDDRTRPRDAEDLLSLLKEASAEDLETARAALALVTERGYHRGKDLQEELDDLLRGRS